MDSKEDERRQTEAYFLYVRVAAAMSDDASHKIAYCYTLLKQTPLNWDICDDFARCAKFWNRLAYTDVRDGDKFLSSARKRTNSTV